MTIDRRELLVGTAAIGAATLLGTPKSGFAATNMSLGEGEITILSDGHMQFPVNFMYPSVPEGRRSQFLTKNGLSADTMTPPCNLTLYQTGDRNILFDVGGGSQFLPTTGKLPDALDEIELAPEDITDVVFTHAHPDHLWGLLDDFDDLFFPEANYYVSEPEWNFWIDPNTVANAPDDQKGLAVGSKRRLEELKDQINLFKPETEVISGIFAHDTSGHTPGHCSFEVMNGNDNLLIIGDALTHPFITFENPEWVFARDHDSERAVATRKRLLDMATTSQMQLIGYHLPGSGIGRAEQHETAYRFVSG